MDLAFTLNHKDDLPLFAQLTRQLKRAIVRGEWPPDRPLPSLRTLVGVLRVNPQTVLHAFQDLEREGLVERRQGQGTFVVPGAAARLAAQEQTEVLSQLGSLAARARELGASEAAIEAAISPPRKLKVRGRT